MFCALHSLCTHIDGAIFGSALLHLLYLSRTFRARVDRGKGHRFFIYDFLSLLLRPVYERLQSDTNHFTFCSVRARLAENYHKTPRAILHPINTRARKEEVAKFASLK